MKKSKEFFSYITVILLAALLALNYYVFVIENHFAPAGLNGIATMVQYKTGFSIGYMSLLINIPLCIFAFFLIEKKFSVKTLLFSVCYSFIFLALQKIDPAFLQYNSDGHDMIYPVIISGVLSGFVYGVALKNNASSGGTDIISRYINKIRPSTNFFIVTFSLNSVVAVASLFVYSDGALDYKPVALCITYCFISNFVGNYIIKGTKSAYKFTIVTTHADEITAEIFGVLHHSATKLEAVGAYTGQEKNVLICVVNKHQINDFQKILAKYDNTFAFHESINETFGNFVRVNNKG